MNEAHFFHYLVLFWLGLAGAIFLTLFFVVAPYGRHSSVRWGPGLRPRTGWMVMESVSPVIFALLFILGTDRYSPTALIFLALWECHYIHRAFIYPLQLRPSSKTIPILIVGLGMLFNGVNSYINGRYLFTLSGGYPTQWLTDPRFIIGTALFVTGFIINRHSDYILRSLRQPREYGYRIPEQGLFRWISCPNYLGEIIIWTGWAIATWSLAGLSFCLWTTANLAPRARAHHIWYKSHFDEYPAQRKTLIPYVW